MLVAFDFQSDAWRSNTVSISLI